jgi:hypothetical protein
VFVGPPPCMPVSVPTPSVSLGGNWVVVTCGGNLANTCSPQPGAVTARP